MIQKKSGKHYTTIRGKQDMMLCMYSQSHDAITEALLEECFLVEPMRRRVKNEANVQNERKSASHNL